MFNLFGNKNEKENDQVDFISQRMRMVDEQLVKKGIQDSLVLRAMRTVPRHKFVNPKNIDLAYHDRAVEIDSRQTVSQPFVVATMTEALELNSKSRVLEIGTGSGYQSAILAEIAESVYTIEIIPSLHSNATLLFHELGYKNIKSMLGDGANGWNVKESFDAIIVTAVAPRVPLALVAQLVLGGILVIPLSKPHNDKQVLMRFVKTEDSLEETELLAVRFVPMRGEIEK